MQAAKLKRILGYGRWIVLLIDSNCLSDRTVTTYYRPTVSFIKQMNKVRRQ